jgi:glycosyltransferase involved in cell wall biosynthesis
MNSLTPIVSAVMPVFNMETYLASAIESILGQTLENFEFLIFDDGSTDNSLSIARSYKDKRLNVFTSSERTGYVRHLNRGLELACGAYIARMDADDIAMPTRFQEQVDFLEAHPDIGICGSWAMTLGAKRRLIRPPQRHDEIKVTLLNSSCMVHPTVMLRKEALCAHGIFYREDYLFAEDYAFWVDLSAHTRLANLPKVLLEKREHGGSVGVVEKQRQLGLTQQLKIQQYETLLERQLDECERYFVLDLFDLAIFNEMGIKKLLTDVKQANRRHRAYAPSLLDDFLSNKLIRYLFRNRKQFSLLRFLDYLYRFRPHLYFDPKTKRQLHQIFNDRATVAFW